MKKNTTHRHSIILALTLFLTPISGFTQILDFNYTALFTIVAADGSFLANTSELTNATDGNRTPVAGTMQYNTLNSSAIFTMQPFLLNQEVAEWTTLYMEDIGSNLTLLNANFNWNGYSGIPVSLVWDTTGLTNAINNGLSNNSTVNGSLGGAIPETSNTVKSSGPFGTITYPLGPSPLATTAFDTTPITSVNFGSNPSSQLPIINDLVVDTTNGDVGIGGSPQQIGPFVTANINLDISTLVVTNMSAVPVPAAFWLFGSGLLGLLGLRRKNR